MTIDSTQLIYLMLLTVLIGSGVAARRMGLRQVFRTLLIWAIIFGGAFLLFTYIDAFRPISDSAPTRHLT